MDALSTPIGQRTEVASRPGSSQTLRDRLEDKLRFHQAQAEAAKLALEKLSRLPEFEEVLDAVQRVL